MFINYCRTCSKALAVSNSIIHVDSHTTELDEVHTDVKTIEISTERACRYLNNTETDALNMIDERFGSFYV